MACQNVGQYFIEPVGGDAGTLKGLGWFDPDSGDDPNVLEIDDSIVKGIVIEVEQVNCFRWDIQTNWPGLTNYEEGDEDLQSNWNQFFKNSDGTNKRFVLPNRCGDKPPDKEWSHHKQLAGCSNNSFFPCNNDTFVHWGFGSQTEQHPLPPDLFPAAQFYVGHGYETSNSSQNEPCFGRHPTVDDINESQLLYINSVYYRSSGNASSHLLPSQHSEFYSYPWPNRALGFKIVVGFGNKRIHLESGFHWDKPWRNQMPNGWKLPLVFPVNFALTSEFVSQGFGFVGPGRQYGSQFSPTNFWKDTPIIIKIVDLVLDQEVWGNCCSPLWPFSVPDDYPIPLCYHTDRSLCEGWKGAEDDYPETVEAFGFTGNRILGTFAGGVPGGEGGLCQSENECNVAGACCENNWPGDPLCHEISATFCPLTRSKIFAGPGTFCSDVDACGSEGACCLIPGECVMQFEQQCQAYPLGVWWDPIWNGPDSQCNFAPRIPGGGGPPDSIGIPPGNIGTPADVVDCPVRGRCCTQDLFGFPQCDHRTIEDCPEETDEGFWGGPGSVCWPWKTPHELCTGACCLFGGAIGFVCSEVVPWDCTGESVFHGFRPCGLTFPGMDGPGGPTIQCDLEPGSCCYDGNLDEPGGDLCRWIDFLWCDFHNGLWNPDARCEFEGPSDLPVNECVFNGCCEFAAPGGARCCEGPTEAQCTALGGINWTSGSCESPPCFEVIIGPPCNF